MQTKFRQLVDQHHREVYSYALHLLNNQAEAEEATQEVYEKLWLHIDHIDTGQAKFWLLKVMRNHCIDTIRRRREKLSSTETLEEELPCQNQMNTPSGYLAASQLSSWLKKAIESLKEPHKSLIVLFDLQEKSVKEIAAITGLKESNIKVSVHRARKQLRAFLKGLDF